VKPSHPQNHSVIELSNHLENAASNGTHRGEIIMNTIQKTAAAFMALVITLVGATLATAPLALADVHPTALHQGTPSLVQTASLGAPISLQG
jgi:hypothetical protein